MFHLDHLPNPLPDEHVEFFLRRHPVTLTGLFLGFALLILTPLIAFLYLGTFRPALLMNQDFLLFLVLLGSLFFLYAWLFLFQNFLDYYLDMWIVTNRRILAIEQTGLFSRTTSELRLYRVQDVTASITGFTNTLFHYGDVEIQTAAEKERFLFEQVPHPNRVAKGILELAETDRQGHIEEAMEEFATVEPKKSTKQA